MIKAPARFLLTTALMICFIMPADVQPQGNPRSVPKLDKNTNLPDSLQWAIETISTYASVGVYGRHDGYFKPGFAFYKGFKLDHADNCTLYLKNEGFFEPDHKPYLCEVTIPIAELDPASGKLYHYTKGNPEVDKHYGTWRMDFLTKDRKEVARIYMKESPLGDFRGSVVSFEFEEQNVAQAFEEGFKQVIKRCQK